MFAVEKMTSSDGAHGVLPAHILKLIEGLNPPQAEAVQHTEGPLLILAGAGTGKTSVLTRRIAYMILTHAAQPHEILAVTFTNKAAKEMAERTEHLIGMPVQGMWLGTFHRLGVRMLRKHAERVGLKPDFVILDPDDQNRVITQLIKELGLDVQMFPPRQVANMLNRWKDNAYAPDTLPVEEAGNLNRMATRFFRAYQERLLSLNAADFGDLLLHPLNLLKQNPDVLESYQRLFKYILVDEYQDTNGVQYQWLQLLAAGHKNIAVVGDDDQSIYAWRGAQVGNILRFEHDFPGAHLVRLEQNYRSTGHILAAANAVISNNRQRHEKALWTSVGDGAVIDLHPMLDDREEARFVADACGRHVRDGGAYTDLAILVRTASQTRALEEALIRAGLPYTVVGGLRFYDRKEVKDALGYLRLIANPADDLAFQRIINVPRRGVGDTSLGTIEQAARSRGIPMESAAQALCEFGEFGGKIGGAIKSFLSNIATWRVQAQLETPDRLAEKVLEESGYIDMIRADKEEDSKARIDNLKELVRALQDYPDLSSFLDHVALVTDADTEETESVRLMTMHAAKGLEFNKVFLPGFEEGLFPHQRALNEEGAKGLEEERRLAYVALTRAKKQLVLSYAHGRRLYGQYMPGAASRFIAEIPEEHIKVHTSTVGAFGGDFGGGYGGGSYGGYGGRSYVGASSFSRGNFAGSRAATGSRADMKSTRAGVDYVKPAEPLITYGTSAKVSDVMADVYGKKDSSDSPYSAGQKVFHQKFGNGEIVSLEGSGADLKIVINFTKAGQKRLLASLANLEVKG